MYGKQNEKRNPRKLPNKTETLGTKQTVYYSLHFPCLQRKKRRNSRESDTDRQRLASRTFSDKLPSFQSRQHKWVRPLTRKLMYVQCDAGVISNMVFILTAVFIYIYLLINTPPHDAPRAALSVPQHGSFFRAYPPHRLHGQHLARGH